MRLSPIDTRHHIGCDGCILGSGNHDRSLRRHGSGHRNHLRRDRCEKVDRIGNHLVVRSRFHLQLSEAVPKWLALQAAFAELACPMAFQVSA